MSLPKLITSIAISLSAGAIGSLFTIQSLQDFYPALIKPPLNPPNTIFGPVWTLLYILIGISLYLVWNTKSSPKRTQATDWFYIQLGLNLLWSIMFFGFRSPLFGLITIGSLFFAIIQTMRLFQPISRSAFWLLAPYLAWVSFATYLNAGIYWLN